MKTKAQLIRDDQGQLIYHVRGHVLAVPVELAADVREILWRGTVHGELSPAGYVRDVLRSLSLNPTERDQTKRRAAIFLLEAEEPASSPPVVDAERI